MAGALKAGALTVGAPKADALTDGTFMAGALTDGALMNKNPLAHRFPCPVPILRIILVVKGVKAKKEE